MMRILSLGAGVQSSTLALMAAAGELEMPDCAIFADTQSEPAAVYKHLDWLESRLPFPVYRETAGSLRDQILAAAQGTQRMDARPPFFTEGGGMLNRQCTQDFKILPIVRKVRELIGVKPKARAPKMPVVEQWIGISLDEYQRMKPSRLPYITHRWPLIEKRMTRADCLAWIAVRGFPQPPKSACTFCPYHNDSQWKELRANDPESWVDALLIDNAIRDINLTLKSKTGRNSSSQWFLHRSLKPLQDVDLRSAEEAGQIDMFNNECEGLCGV